MKGNSDDASMSACRETAAFPDGLRRSCKRTARRSLLTGGRRCASLAFFSSKGNSRCAPLLRRTVRVSAIRQKTRLFLPFAGLAIYTGAFQFVLFSFLSSGAACVTMALTALLMNSRQTLYSLTFPDDFKSMGRRRLYMIHTMTDETYAVNCALDKNDPERKDIMFFTAHIREKCFIFPALLAEAGAESVRGSGKPAAVRADVPVSRLIGCITLTRLCEYGIVRKTA
ncbi:MAG: AzlC family ABC transporter permease [Eubacteriales bacterium]